MHGGSTGLIAAGMLSSSPSKIHMITTTYLQRKYVPEKGKFLRMYIKILGCIKQHYKISYVNNIFFELKVEYFVFKSYS